MKHKIGIFLPPILLCFFYYSNVKANVFSLNNKYKHESRKFLGDNHPDSNSVFKLSEIEDPNADKSMTDPCDGVLYINDEEAYGDRYLSCDKTDLVFFVDDTYSGVTYTLDYGDGSTPFEMTVNNNYYHSFQTPGIYTISFTKSGSECSTATDHFTMEVKDCFNCEDCIGSFAPEPGRSYVVGAWVKEGGAEGTVTTYTKPEIYIGFKEFNSNNVDYVGPFTAKGQIIDGWQRIEEEFEVPATADSILIKLNQNTSNSNDVCYFDDLRIYPEKGSIKSYVFDPISLRLVAELDENNYATFYEYDEEGNLIRVKKETERGIMTIQENRSNTYKKP
jgi:hypothetical protein